MNVREITLEEALDFVKREESHFYDKKSSSVSGKGVAKIAVALSNSDGGEFIIGIKDSKEEPKPNKRWDGVVDIEKLNGHLQTLFRLNPSLEIRYEILKGADVSGKVLRIIVEKGAEVATSTDGTVYVRHGAQSLPLKDPDKISALGFAKGAKTYEDYILKELPAETIVDSDELNTFLSEYSPKTDSLDFCVNQNLIDFKTWEPRICSALLFHPVPSSVIPKKCSVKITRYETREDQPERDHLAEQFTIEGPAYRIINETVEKITSVMSSVKVWTSDGLGSLSYPPEAIWETFVNAIIHRDYSISDDIQILIFNDRIEILSPGKLPGYVSIENILDA